MLGWDDYCFKWETPKLSPIERSFNDTYKYFKEIEDLGGSPEGSSMQT
jgi:hypothetical protein